MIRQVALVLGLSMIALPAWAQDDGMEFGEEEVATASESSPVAKFIEEGKKLYEQKKYDEASLLFYKVLQEKDVAAEAYYPEAQYELGKTLFRMELYQGALNYFGKIVEQGEAHPYFLPTLRGLVLLTDVVPQDPLLMEQLAAYQNFFPRDVPEKYRDRFAYLVGRHLYAQLEVEPALKMLNAVSARSEDYPKARYIAGVTHVANYDAEPAVQAFKDVLRYLTAKQADGKLSDEEAKLLELSNMAMARVFYSTGQYDTSLKYYGRIDRKSELWPIALYESSWAYFQLDLYNKALGNLHTLNSPFYDGYYFPEGPILSAVIFFYNCKYDRVRYVLEDFIFEYEPLLQEVEAVMAQQGADPEAMYEWLKAQRSGEGDHPELQQVAHAALDDQQISRKLTLIELIEKEIEKIGGMPSQWKDSALGGQLIQDSELAISFAKSDAGTIASQRLARVQRELGDLLLEQEKIMFEVTRGERGEIEADLRSEMEVAANVTERPDVEVSDEELYWTFDGEYWRDELGFYIFNINSECKR